MYFLSMHFGKLEIKFDLTQKKSPFLMTFLFAPLIGGMLQPKLSKILLK